MRARVGGRCEVTSAPLGVALLALAASLAGESPPPRLRPRVPATLPACVRVDAAQVLRTLPPDLLGSNLQYTNYGDGVLDPATLALRPEVVAKTRELSPRTIRFPGGSHADVYHWRDGVGPQADRPVGVGYFGHEPQTNEYGTDEHLALCAAVGAEATITVNFGTGTPQEAANWVEYLNGPVPASGTEAWRVTSWAGDEAAPPGYFAWLRGQFGHPEPYRVRRFEVGNEVYNDWSQRYDSTAYAHRFLEYLAAMKAVDPSIRVAAVGYERANAPWGAETQPWNRTVAQIAGAAMDALHVHTYTPLHDGQSLFLTTPDPLGGVVELPTTGDWEVRVWALGFGGFGPYPPADGEPARLEISVDGTTAGVFTLTSPVLARYDVRRHLRAGRHTVSLAAPNAHLDPVTLTGRAVVFDATLVLEETDSQVRLALIRPDHLHAATMAGPVQIGGELAAIAELLRTETGRQDIELWVTEANTWFGLFGLRPDLHWQMRAGLATADLALQSIAAGASLFQQWSLVGDGYFGLIPDPLTLGEQAGFHTLSLLGRGLRPQLLATTVVAPTFDLPTAFGAVQPAAAVPTLDVLATRDEEVLALLLANKHAERTLRTRVELAGWPAAEAEAETVFSAAPDTQDVNPDDAAYPFRPGRVGQALHLDASRPLRHPTVGRLSPEAGTLEVWLCPDWPGDDGREHAILAAGFLFHLVKTDTGHLVAAVISEQLDEISVAGAEVASWRPGEWHHVAVTWQEGGELALFLDGSRAATTPLAARWTAVEPATGLLLGASPVVTGGGFGGAMDELRLSSSIRGAAELRESWQAGAAGRPLSADATTTTLFAFDGTLADAVRDERTRILRRRLLVTDGALLLDLPPTSLTLLTVPRGHAAPPASP